MNPFARLPVPPLVVTVTVTAPELPAGVVAVTLVLFTTTTFVAAALPNVTTAPAAKFVPVMVTAVPPTVDPLLGLILLTVITTGSTVRVTVLLTLEYDAVSVTEVAPLTVPAAAVNAADVAPAGTVTLDGTFAAEGFELASETTTPPVGAAEVSVTVPVTEFPLVTVLELSVTPLRAALAAAGLTVIG